MIGVSKDTPEAQAKFKKKYDLPFPLLADVDTKMMQAYGVWKEKNMYGKISMGCERTTFLIDEAGKIAGVWPKVKVDGHAAAVLAGC